MVGGVGCLLLLVLGGVTAYYVYLKALEAAREAAATLTETSAEAILSSFELPDEAKDVALKPVREFAQKIRAGEVSLEQGTRVLAELIDGGGLRAIASGIAAQMFEQNYLQPSAARPTRVVLVAADADGMAAVG